MMLHFQEIFDIKLTRQEHRYQKSRDFSTYQKWRGFYEIIFFYYLVDKLCFMCGRRDCYITFWRSTMKYFFSFIY